MEINQVYVNPKNKNLYYKSPSEVLTDDFRKVLLSAGREITKITQNFTSNSSTTQQAVVRATLQPPKLKQISSEVSEKDTPGRLMKRTKRRVSFTPPTGIVDIPVSNISPTSAYFNTLPPNNVIFLDNYQLKFYKSGNYSFYVTVHIRNTQLCKVSIYLVAYEGITRTILDSTTVEFNGISDLNMQFNATVNTNQLISIEAQSGIEGVTTIALNRDVEGNITGSQISVTVLAGADVSV